MNKLAVNPDYLSVAAALRYFIKSERRNPVILCVGSDRVTGDSLGPLTGHLLTDKYNVAAYVYGTLESPVTAKNLVATAEFIRRRHANDFVIAIDAALGKKEDIGVVKLSRGGIEPGSALCRNLPCVGDYSITAVVSDFGGTQVVLQDIRLHLVYSLAECIARGISEAVGTVFCTNCKSKSL